MSNTNQHIVDYFKFCRKCKHWDKGKESDICSDCLEQNVRESSRKPVHYEEEKK